MAYKVEASQTSPSGTRAILKAPTPPKMSDYDLTRIGIREIENACIVECSYTMKPAALDKLKKATKRDYVDYETRESREEHSFTTREEAAEFISARVLGQEHAGSPSRAASKGKTKVKKV